ncbi:MAG TPA: CAP domain-containing protein [Pyrinomonadaceae bacterium]|nr:CAP domain-containing protein [Pyrinomonadaceae bacterium]
MKYAGFRSALLRPVSLVFSLTLLVALSSATALSQTKPGGDDYMLSPLERAVLEEMNLARTNPAQYAGYLEALKKYYKGKTVTLPGLAPLDTIEGAVALEEAITYLRQAKPIAPLQLSKGMCMGAKDQSFDQSKTGDVSHQGKDKSFSWDRVARYGQWQTPISENIAYDSGTARDIVINLIIDDGVPQRGHRNNIFNSSYIVTGVACGNHPLFGGMCVCTFAGGFTDKPAQNTTAVPAQQPAATPPTAPKARKL